VSDLSISILVDNPNSWMNPYAQDLCDSLTNLGHHASFLDSHQSLRGGDILFILSCEGIISKDILATYSHNIVVHESVLPQGKGWSPLTWQILDGKNEITITLFEAAEKVDSGKIYLQDILVFDGHELIAELRDQQAQKTLELCVKFAQEHSTINGLEQVGEASFYPRREAKDSELDIDQSIKEQFEKFRVADNERYPMFFEYRGCKYRLKIEKY
jgi:methionyl-tRNA formyltransferase